MRKFTIAAIVVLALAITGVASASLVPGVYDPGSTGCPTANCATNTNAAPGADITGVTGPFTSASFTLASTSQRRERGRAGAHRRRARKRALLVPTLGARLRDRGRDAEHAIAVGFAALAEPTLRRVLGELAGSADRAAV